MLIDEVEDWIRDARKAVAEHGKVEEKQRLLELEEQTRKVINDGDIELLRKKLDELRRLYYGLMWQQPRWVNGFFYHLETQKAMMTDASRAAVLISRGNRAIDAGDFEQVQAVVIELLELIPEDRREEQRLAFGSTVQ